MRFLKAHPSITSTEMNDFPGPGSQNKLYHLTVQCKLVYKILVSHLSDLFMIFFLAHLLNKMTAVSNPSK